MFTRKSMMGKSNDFVIVKLEQINSIHNKIIQMTQEPNSLFGFLKRKSLFSQSPTRPSGPKSKSKQKGLSNNNFLSKEVVESQVQSKNYNSQSYDQQQFYQQKEGNKRNIRYMLTTKDYDSNPKGSKTGRFNNNTHNFGVKQQKQKNSKVNQKNSLIRQSKHISNFQSARIQSQSCLTNLLSKIDGQIKNINFKIDMMNSKMQKILHFEFKRIRECIDKLVEDAFKDIQISIKEYVLDQQKQLLSNFIQIRSSLQVDFKKIENMKLQLKSPQWRKVAGEILATNLQHIIEQKIQASKFVEVGHWQLSNIGGSSLKIIEEQLKKIIKIK